VELSGIKWKQVELTAKAGPRISWISRISKSINAKARSRKDAKRDRKLRVFAPLRLCVKYTLSLRVKSPWECVRLTRRSPEAGLAAGADAGPLAPRLPLSSLLTDSSAFMRS
jgi:hypothetical protein